MRLYVWFWPWYDIDGWKDQVKIYIWKDSEDKHSIKKDKQSSMISKSYMLRLPSTLFLKYHINHEILHTFLLRKDIDG